MGKQLHSAFQHLVLDEVDSDCGSDKYLTVNITPSNKNMFLFRYAKGKNGEIVLDYNNLEKCVGKKVKIRSPLYCKGDKICNKCAGSLFYILGMGNVGLLNNKIGTTIMQRSMKLFHNSSIKLSEIDYESYIREI